MEGYLADLRSREVGADSILPGLWPDVQIVESHGCFLLGTFVKKPHLSPADFPDRTALECSANKLKMESMFDRRLAASCPLLLLTAGMMTAVAVARQLARHPAKFNVIVSYDGDSCAVRFHKIRAGQRWLQEDLEGYADEGVLAFEAGAQVPLPLLNGV